MYTHSAHTILHAQIHVGAQANIGSATLINESGSTGRMLAYSIGAFAEQSLSQYYDLGVWSAYSARGTSLRSNGNTILSIATNYLDAGIMLTYIVLKGKTHSPDFDARQAELRASVGAFGGVLLSSNQTVAQGLLTPTLRSYDAGYTVNFCLRTYLGTQAFDVAAWYQQSLIGIAEQNIGKNSVFSVQLGYVW